MDESLHTHVEMKATFATWTVYEMLLHDSNFLCAEFPTNVEMKTSNSLNTVHNNYPPAALSRPSIVYLFILTSEEGLSFPQPLGYTASDRVYKRRTPPW